MKVEAPEGRIALGYRAALERFKTVRSLVDLRGITGAKELAEFNLNDIQEEIADCCAIRDQMAHGIWVRRNEILGLRLTKGGFESEEGWRSRAITPQGMEIPAEYYDQAKAKTKSTIAEVQHLTAAVKIALQSSLEKSGELPP